MLTAQDISKLMDENGVSAADITDVRRAFDVAQAFGEDHDHIRLEQNLNDLRCEFTAQSDPNDCRVSISMSNRAARLFLERCLKGLK